jgi:hypothetical protein
MFLDTFDDLAERLDDIINRPVPFDEIDPDHEVLLFLNEMEGSPCGSEHDPNEDDATKKTTLHIEGGVEAPSPVAAASSGSAAWCQTYYGPACKAPMKLITFGQGKKIWVNKDSVRMFRWLNRRFNADSPKYWKLIGTTSDTGAYSCRNIAGTNTPSTHSWALSIDVRWQRNGYGVSVERSEVWQRAKKVVVKAEKSGFRWGGRFSKPDPMHFEVRLTPAEVRRFFYVSGRKKKSEWRKVGGSILR